VAGLPPEPQALALWLAERLGASQLDWALPEGAAMPAIPADFPVPTRRL
jgi:dihydroneopterin aldolase